MNAAKRPPKPPAITAAINWVSPRRQTKRSSKIGGFGLRNYPDHGDRGIDDCKPHSLFHSSKSPFNFVVNVRPPIAKSALPTLSASSAYQKRHSQTQMLQLTSICECLSGNKMRTFRVILFGVSLAILAGPGVLSAATRSTETFVQSIVPFNRALAALCPAQHLENVNPGILDLIISNYRSRLSKRVQLRMTRAAQPICVESVAGVSCSNIAYIRAARKVGMTVSLARAACSSGYVCRSPFVCNSRPN